MPFNKHILVVINPEKDEQVALNKAIRLSERLGSIITALVRKKHATDQLMQTLAKKLSVAALKDISVVVEISNETSLLRAILRCQHDKEFSLIIKEPHAPSLTDHVFLSDDWKLLRGSRCPVFMVRSENHWEDGSPLLLCVNADPADGEHQALNTRVLKVGRFLTEVGNGECNLVTAYPSLMQSAKGKYQVPSLLERQYRTACQKMLTNNDITDTQIHVDQGPAELLIPQVAERIKAKLVVLGTVARSGLQSILLGNTAEQVLSRLQTDILILPPE
ncbi:universal stress protein [Thalassotalea fonticola]|uniref:Universal stress protein n=1 Tax=Thalassotalea fonticola TaxID=3065649 RepID=A0ABZ0GS06_9GAMM|nr:universal stress protein [Colwelliaceae bacterium S1-1]